MGFIFLCHAKGTRNADPGPPAYMRQVSFLTGIKIKIPTILDRGDSYCL